MGAELPIPARESDLVRQRQDLLHIPAHAVAVARIETDHAVMELSPIRQTLLGQGQLDQTTSLDEAQLLSRDRSHNLRNGHVGGHHGTEAARGGRASGQGATEVERHRGGKLLEPEQPRQTSSTYVSFSLALMGVTVMRWVLAEGGRGVKGNGGLDVVGMWRVRDEWEGCRLNQRWEGALGVVGLQGAWWIEGTALGPRCGAVRVQGAVRLGSKPRFFVFVFYFFVLNIFQ